MIAITLALLPLIAIGQVCPPTPNWVPRVHTALGSVLLDSRNRIGTLAECMAGPAMPYPDDGCDCRVYDADGDGDVDLRDFEAAQLGLSRLLVFVRELP